MRPPRPQNGDSPAPPCIGPLVLTALLVAALPATGGCAGTEPGPGKDGVGESEETGRQEAAPGQLHLEDVTGLELQDLDGTPVAPLRPSAVEVVVFVFTSTDCPISNRYAPELGRLHERFDGRAVDFWMVYPDPADTPASIRRHLDSFGYPFPALRDPAHRLVDVAGVEVTPEVAVFGPSRELAYRGRINDWYVDFGVARSEPTRHDLRQALQAVLDGRPVERPRTRAVGCFIADLAGPE